MIATVYGLKNCDTCRKARKWLDAAGIQASFVDLRAEGIDAARLADWVKAESWQTLFNRSSRTWRQLDADQRADLNQAKALALMVEYPTLIKRPVLEHDEGVIVGFSPARYEAALAGAH